MVLPAVHGFFMQWMIGRVAGMQMPENSVSSGG